MMRSTPTPNPNQTRGRHRRIGELIAGLAFVLVLSACGGSIETELADIRALQEAGDFAGTIEPLRDVLATEPNHPEANLLLGVALVQTRQPSLAVWPLRKAAGDEEFAVTSGLLLASTLVGLGSVDEAVRASDDVLKVEPDNAMALQLRANANVTAGRPEDALRDAQHLIELLPESHSAFALKAMALTKLGKTEEAEAALKDLARVAEAGEDENAKLRSCVALAVHYRDNESDQAGPAFDTCVARFPTATLVLNEAQAYYDGLGKSAEATAMWRAAMEADPDNFALRSQLASRLEAKGQFDEAEQLLKEGTELFADSAAWGRLATYYENRGRPEEARDAVAQAVLAAAGEPSDELLFRQADLLVAAGDLDAAEALLESIGQDVFRDLIKGRVLQARGQTAAALEAYEAALSRWPNNAQARYLAGLAAEDLGDIDRAAAHFREAVRAEAESSDASLSLAAIQLERAEFGEAVSLAEKHLAARDPYSVEARKIIARAAAALGQEKKARLAVQDLSAIPDLALDTALEEAALERTLNGPAEAARAIENSGVELTSLEAAPVVGALVQDYIASGQTERAFDVLDRAISANPDAPQYYDPLGRALYTAHPDEPERYMAAFETALEKDPNYGPTLLALGTIDMINGRYDEAAQKLERAVENGQPEAGYEWAQVLMAQGDIGAAETRLRDVLRDRPGHSKAANDLAWMLAQQGKDLEYAYELADRAVKHNRSQPVPAMLDTLGWVQLKRGQPAAAVESFRLSLEINPGDSSVRYRLGRALQALGQEDAAAQSFTTALEGSPFPEVEDARAQLALLQGAQ